MEIILGNRIRLKKAPTSLKNVLAEELRTVNPKYMEAQAAGRSLYEIDQYIVNFVMLPDDSMLVPRGMRCEILALARDLGLSYKLCDDRTFFDYMNVDSSKISYKPYQTDAVAQLINEPEGVLVAPAGSGKTVMGLSLIPLLGQPTLWLTHTDPLAAQATERARIFLPSIGEIGLFGRGKWKKGDVLTIGLIQTLFRDMDRLAGIMNSFGMIVVDECHRSPARTFTDVIVNLNPRYIYGLTATPYRRDGLESLMFQTLGPATAIVPLEKVANTGGVMIPTVRCRHFRHPSRIDDNNIQEILTQHIVNNRKRNNMIVEDVIREAKAGHFCIVMSDRRKHCEILYAQIKNFWPAVGIATGKYSKKYVQEQVLKYNNGEITILVATSALLGEGFDAPFLDRAFICMPFRNRTKTEQIIGRIQRTHEGKKDAVAYDYLDTNIGVLENQFYSRYKDCRHRTYTRLGVKIES